MRHAPRGRHGAHVDEQLDMVMTQELDQLIEGSGRVPDRED
jgi:hypothetical protein